MAPDEIVQRCQVCGSGWPRQWVSSSYPDLTPLDYFVWGHVKSLIYYTPVDIEFELLARILVACYVIHETPGIFQKVPIPTSTLAGEFQEFGAGNMPVHAVRH
jgi:hypothetical protein